MTENNRPLKLRLKLTLIFTGVFLFLLLPEILFRFNDYKWISDDLYYKFGPFVDKKSHRWERIPLNKKDPYLFWREPRSFEFRGVKYNTKKDTNLIRIICLGDSCTQGYIKESYYYMERKETYPFQLETLLNRYDTAAGKTFEVINAGVGGYSSLQGLRYFKKELLKYKPDIVTFYFGINDVCPSITFTDSEQVIISQWVAALHNICMKSRLYQFAAYFQKRRIFEKHKDTRIKNPGNLPRVSPEEYKNNITALYEITKGKGIKSMLINFPTNPPHMLAKYNAVLKNAAGQYNIPLVDIVTIAEKNSDENDRIFLDVCHPTPYFNRIIAKEIYKALLLDKSI